VWCGVWCVVCMCMCMCACACACGHQAANEKVLLEQAKAAEITAGNTTKAELAAHMRQAEERNKALREKERLLSDNDARIKDLEKSRR
jgi:hypothetical protein